MRHQKMLAALLAVLLLFALAGCSVGTDKAASDTIGEMNQSASSESTAPSQPEMDWGGNDMMDDAATMPETEPGVEVSEESNAIDPADFTEKIIYSGHIGMQTTEFDAALERLEQAVASYGGFIQDSSVQGYAQTYADGTTAVVDRWATYTVRIPSEQFDAFLGEAGGIGNVTDSSRTAENVTSQYTDYEARLESLTIQEERLLAMLEESGDLESLITLESRLSEVRYEIESIERNLRNLDQRLTYSTVNIDIQEVEVYTPTVSVKRSFGEKLSDAFSDGWESFVAFLSALVLGLASSLPGLILFILVVIVIVVLLRRILRRAKAKRQTPPSDSETSENSK